MIDWLRVNTLREDVGDEDFDDVVEIFIEEVTGMVTRLRINPQMETLGEDLHALKGSALNLGFATFSAYCQTGESLAAHGRPAEIELGQILSSYDESLAAFLTGLKKPPAA
ncbi:Hpt domain-containing protein [Sulfitobacter guttiformis]|uniref:Hpt domain-containing protein n=1 Tax=Sulfitobacter guttiformis TaxID=74349 RepID=A0A420DS58_9RHOB|nr:Hpt domain-containing protein [Sulfitobacter guttiformis]KIN74410.1 Hpt domain protein [Sulfitobacter guttiformis KCTC 32187]RKE97008.1 Hpt domain-containing protein [Sulfitobacter guttiformis]